MESPSLEIFQIHLDKVLYSLLWVTLLGQGVGLGDPQRALPTPAMLGFCDTGWGSLALLLPTRGVPGRRGGCREPWPHPRGAPTSLPAHRDQIPSQTAAAVPSMHLHPHVPTIYVSIHIYVWEQPLFCSEKGHFNGCFCFAQLLRRQRTAGARPVPGLWPEQSQPPGRGGDPSGTNPGARRGSLRHESWLAAAPSAGERERLRLLSLLVEPRGSVWDPGSFCPRQRCGAAPQGWGAADVFLDLLNESITFFLLFSHPHQQLLPAEGGRVICLFVGRRKTENRAVP